MFPLQQVTAARTQFLDANGAPLAGGTVGTYIPGTFVAITTYQTPTQETQNENPITLDDLGSAAIWYSGLVRMIVKDVLGNVIYDQVGGNAGGLFSDTVLTPAMFGYRDDGSNSYAPVQKMFDYAAALNGATCDFGSGTYPTNQGWKVPSNTTVNLNDATFIAAPFADFIPYPTPDGGNLYFVFRNWNWDVYTLTDHDIHFIGGTANPDLSDGALYFNGHFINLRQVERSSFTNVRSFNMADCIAGVGVKDCILFGCYAKNAANCSFDFWMGFKNVMVVNCYDEDCQTLVNGNSALWLTTDVYTSSGLLVTGCTSKRCTNAAIFIDPLGNNSFVRDVKIVNNMFIGSGSGTAKPITVHAASDVIITGNTISNFTSAYLIQIGRSVYNAVTSESRQCTASNNVFYDCATTGVYIFATGPHLTVEGNIARNCTTVIAVAFSDPTSYCGPNDLDGWTVAYVGNSDPSTGNPTVPAMEFDVDRTARKFNFAQPVKSTFFESSYLTGLTATGTNAATALVLTKALNFVQTTPSGTGVMLPNIDFGQEVVVKNAGANTLTVYPTSGATIDGAASVTLTTTSKARFVKTSATIWWTI